MKLTELKAIKLAELFSALSDASRVRILSLLIEGEMSVGPLAEGLNMTQSAVSHQLRGLRQMKLARSRKSGRQVYYALDDDHVTKLYRMGLAPCRAWMIAQSWSVLSGAGDKKRSRMAMEALDKNLVRREHNLIQLLDPPFDKSNLNPGYIKGYVPGVRENGGQSTHAAIWAAMAFAAFGDSKRAWELLAIINPINHTTSPEDIAKYKAEPYVVAADIYAVTPHTGRGGWTWYTGSAGWTYRLIVESLLGLRLEVDKLHIEPCIPTDWQTYKVHYRYRETFYHISVFQAHENNPDLSLTVDGVQNVERIIPLVERRGASRRSRRRSSVGT